MSNDKERSNNDNGKKLNTSSNNKTEGKGGRLSLKNSSRKKDGKRTVEVGSVRQSFSHGRSKEVQVEIKKPKRRKKAGAKRAGLTVSEQERRQRVFLEMKERRAAEEEKNATIKQDQEKEQKAQQSEESEKESTQVTETSESNAKNEQIEASDGKPPPLKGGSDKTGGIQLATPSEKLRPIAERAIMPKKKVEPPKKEEKKEGKKTPPRRSSNKKTDQNNGETRRVVEPKKTLHLNSESTIVEPPIEDGKATKRERGARRHVASPRKVSAPANSGSGRRPSQERRSGRIDVRAAIEGEDGGKRRSLASVRRQRDREKRQAEKEKQESEQVKIVRDVIIPETITVGELSNRMAERQGEVIKALMNMGLVATSAQIIDADTAELVVEEFGHRVKRVAESDVEIGIEVDDKPEDMKARPPVVTVMGHVDHGKTSLLDALRTTDANVADGEAGGITQHIGAYQITVKDGKKITFIDTPGHAAFTEMRARGAAVTDIVVLVVAADDSVMPQTIEAIKHAKAANVSIIIAINKMDRPDADANRVRTELLNHEIVVESMSGDVQDVEISAVKKQGLDKLIDAILLQAEMLDLQANPNRPAEGAVIESRLDRGRGTVATLLNKKGTLNRGDIVVAGTKWGRVRALLDDCGKQVKSAGPAFPVEILGITGVPDAGVPFVVVENDTRAKEITEFRQRKEKEKENAVRIAARGTLDQMLDRIKAGEQKELALLIKTDVRGSAEALQATVEKLSTDEVGVRVLNASVGQITESDVQLAKASDALIIAFNVRATSQARQLANHENVDIRYYSIIYQVIDDVQELIKGKTAPKHREKFIGYAEVRQTFDISKIGRIAGCYVTEGIVKRGCGVRLLRDGVVIHEGTLSQLKRFKDDVKEVSSNYECGLSFAGYNDIKEGDVVECFEMEVIKD